MGNGLPAIHSMIEPAVNDLEFVLGKALLLRADCERGVMYTYTKHMGTYPRTPIHHTQTTTTTTQQ